MTIYDTDDKGNIVVLYDSRWQYPELLGYKETDPQYEMLREKHRRYHVSGNDSNSRCGKEVEGMGTKR